MNQLRLNDPFHHHMAKKRPVYIIGGEHHDEHEALVVSKPPDFALPPLNTHITFLRYTQSYSTQDHVDLNLNFTVNASDKNVLPEIYDWRYVYPSDDEDTKNKKKFIMPPDNQYLCGSCWAISSSSVIGDAFVVAGLVNWRPEISTTWALTCYPQGKCDGGNPAVLLQDIAKGSGIPSKHCLDYSFCANNEKCNGSATQHFETRNLSSLIPTECGCYYGGETKHYNYKINNDIKTLAINEGATSAENIQTAIKQHIITYGPVLAGFFVMRNFSSGYFTKVNGGVYIDRCNYIPGESLAFDDRNASSSSYRGSHAVAIIGWGLAKNIVYNTNQRGDVPYWYCRNSWGPTWGGDDGYFKIAMYPFNKVSQFGKVVDIVDSQNITHRCGGIITFTVNKPPDLINFKTLTNKPQNLLHDDNYYKKTEEGYKPASNPQPPPVPSVLPITKYYNIDDITFYFILPIFLLIFIILVVKIVNAQKNN